MSFNPRIRTGYSFRTAVGTLEKVADRLVEIGQKDAPITDVASAFGFVKWTELCKKKGLRPIYGVELAVTRSINAKKPATDLWTFLALDSLKPLHDLITMATQQFHYTPLLTVAQACAAVGVQKIVGHRSPLEEIPASDHLYVGLGPAVVKGYLRQAVSLGHRLAAVSDNRYPCEGGEGFYETICGRGASTQSYPQWIMGVEEWEASVEEVASSPEMREEAVRNSLSIIASSTAKLVPAEMVHPERPMTLREMCEAGAKKLGCDLTRPEYAERLNKELKLIEDKQFEDYFFLVGDICQWARQRMIVGPGRGSSCGSLVCFCLEITTIDPLQFGTIFERFIDINRGGWKFDKQFEENGLF